MKKAIIYKSERSNLVEITPPPSKSHTIRALLFAGLSNDQSIISNYLLSEDTRTMMTTLQSMGVKINVRNESLYVCGLGDKLYEIKNLYVDANNSGIITRFVTAILSLSSAKVVMTGDHSIQTLRSIKALMDAMQQMNCSFKYLKKYGYAPVQIQGPIQPGVITMDGSDSQPVSAMLIACSFLKEKSVIFVNNPKEKPWIDVTLYWLRMLNAEIENNGYEKYSIQKPVSYKGLSYSVPSDFSSAAFLIAVALICNVKTILNSIDFEDVQGDKIIVDHLVKMGAGIKKDIKNKQLIIESNCRIEGGLIDMDSCIDALPILAVLGCFMKNKLSLVNCKIARKKESNRLEAITYELRKMGAKIHCFQDKVEVFPSELHGATVKSYYDHRIAMALSIAALGVRSGHTIIEDIECVSKTYPHFFQDIQKFGAKVQ